MSEVLWDGKTIQQYMSELLYTKRMRAYDERANTKHYVYRLFDADARLIYIGCTYDVESRLKSHRHVMWWAPQIARIKITVHPTKAAAHEVERAAITAEKPRWNVNGKWAARSTFGVQDYADYIKALELHPDGGTDVRVKKIELARRLMALAA